MHHVLFFNIAITEHAATALAMIRNIAKLSPTALLADAIILTGIAYIFGNEIYVIAHHSIADVKLFNKNDFSLLLG